MFAGGCEAIFDTTCCRRGHINLLGLRGGDGGVGSVRLIPSSYMCRIKKAFTFQQYLGAITLLTA